MHSGKEDCWSTAWHNIINPYFAHRTYLNFVYFQKKTASTFQNRSNVFLVRMRFQFVYCEIKTSCLNIVSVKLASQRVIYLATSKWEADNFSD